MLVPTPHVPSVQQTYSFTDNRRMCRGEFSVYSLHRRPQFWGYWVYGGPYCIPTVTFFERLPQGGNVCILISGATRTLGLGVNIGSRPLMGPFYVKLGADFRGFLRYLNAFSCFSFLYTDGLLPPSVQTTQAEMRPAHTLQLMFKARHSAKMRIFSSSRGEDVGCTFSDHGCF